MAETGTAGVECVKDASTSPLEETACGSFGRTLCKCWACNPSVRALLLIAVWSVVPLLCSIWSACPLACNHCYLLSFYLIIAFISVKLV